MTAPADKIQAARALIKPLRATVLWGNANPDVMKAAEAIAALADLADAQAQEIAKMWLLLRQGADLLQVEADALKEGIGVAGEWEANTCPEDQPTIEAIRELEGWIANVAAMQPRAALGETP